MTDPKPKRVPGDRGLAAISRRRAAKLQLQSLEGSTDRSSLLDRLGIYHFDKACLIVKFKLRAVHKKRKVSARKLHALTGMPKSMWTWFFSGSAMSQRWTEDFTTKTLFRLCLALDVEPRDMMPSLGTLKDLARREARYDVDGAEAFRRSSEAAEREDRGEGPAGET